jgi:hypothetical protein
MDNVFYIFDKTNGISRPVIPASLPAQIHAVEQCSTIFFQDSVSAIRFSSHFLNPVRSGVLTFDTKSPSVRV